jgi:uncharacterized protein YndB with AHSA1/START domain
MAKGNEYEVVRTRTVAAKPDEVFELIADFHRWRDWSPWEDVDPELTRTYSGAEKGVGAVYEWSGNRKAGQGRMEITKAEEPSQVVVAVQFIKPFKSTSTSRFELAEDPDGTLVTWRMTGAKTLATKIMGVFKSMDDFIGADYDTGLARLADAVKK